MDTDTGTGAPTLDTVTAWCRGHLADLLDVPVELIDPAADLDDVGVDSALAVSLLVEIEDRFGVELTPETLFDDPTIDGVARQVLDRLAAGRP